MDAPTKQAKHVLNSDIKYEGTGHPDISKHEFLSNVHRDTYASILGRQFYMNYIVACTDKSMEEVRLELLERMLMPCGSKIEE